MQFENHKEEVPFAHYASRFREMDPREAIKRLPGSQWDGKRFYVQLMHRSYAVAHPECSVAALADDSVPPLGTQTFLLRYLLESRNTAWQGGWKTFREMPWGETYQKAFSGRALTRAAFAFGSRIDAFRTACEQIGGAPVPQGDAGYEFNFIGNFKVRILVWEGDEEFPPSAQILYSDNFAAGFTAEDRVVAADILISAIRAHM